ncbi:uncharacterized protein LOC104423941 [Eucalyptus grandis]|uniref:uncharacterized protein LOC104423941 n=1 Tax=Eucalyptus grandis TaxID=71139 RepID=UPI00192EED10|nr:uncharacterized protein LOC104423941 [Eucalyptus grandis]
MGFSLTNAHGLWKEWGLQLLVLFSLFLQLTLATLASWRKSIFRNWIQVVLWTTYLSADSIATLALGIMSSRLANMKETKGTIDTKSQIMAFWAPFLLLHLGGPDTITSYALEDNELWLRQLARLCVQVGLAFYIYFLALWGSTLWILAAGMILVGFIRYAERTLCLYLASEGRLQGSMLPRPDFGSVYPRNVARYTLKKEEGYRVGIDELTRIPALEDHSVKDFQATLDKAYELFNIFKLLFVGLNVSFVDLGVSRPMFKGPDMKAVKAFKIVEIELGFMYDLLYTKAPLLNRRWGIIRWVISLFLPCAMLVFFSFHDKKDYSKVDICITFSLISGAILLEIFSLILAISSDWVQHWRIQRPKGSAISSAITFFSFSRSLRWSRWSNSVAQFSLLGSSMRKRKGIFRYPRLAMLGDVVERNFYIDYKELKEEIKELIFKQMTDVVTYMEKQVGLKSALASLKLEASELLKKSNCDHLKWSLDEKEFDQSIIIWHIATELCHYEDCHSVDSDEVRLHDEYVGMGVLRYQDTLVEVQKFFEDELVMLPKKKVNILSVIEWAQKLFKKEAHAHSRLCNCFEEHESRESRDLCEVCYLLLQVRADIPVWKMSGAESMSVLFDACHLAGQLKSVETWNVISKVWARMMMYAACQCTGYEHSESLSRGGELLSHIWLLMAHLGIAEPLPNSGAPHVTKLTMG